MTQKGARPNDQNKIHSERGGGKYDIARRKGRGHNENYIETGGDKTKFMEKGARPKWN